MAKKTIEEQVDDNSNMLNLIERDLETIKNNHLFHLEQDVSRLRQTVDKMDTRMWAILILFVSSIMAGMFGERLITLL